MSGNTRDSGRTTASRLLALLSAFSPAEPILTLTRLAELSDLPIATTHRLAGELAAWGAFERLPDGRFQVGMRLWQVGSLAPGHRDLRSVAMPFMEDLYEATHENVQLVVRDGRVALPLEIISGRHAVPTRTEVGGRLPLHATGVGKVILAFSEPELLAALVADGLDRYTERTIVLPGVLARTLRQVRQTGTAFSIQEMSAGACSVASPIFGPGGELAAALAVIVRSSAGLAHLVAAVRAAALGATRRLSAPVPPGGNRSWTPRSGPQHAR